MQVLTNCYLAVLKKFRLQYPNAHFEVITRTAGSVLAPSWKLLTLAKEVGLSFNEYEKLFTDEINNNPEAKKRLEELREIGNNQIIFLVCFEKNASRCHRSIVKRMLLDKLFFENNNFDISKP